MRQARFRICSDKKACPKWSFLHILLKKNSVRYTSDKVILSSCSLFVGMDFFYHRVESSILHTHFCALTDTFPHTRLSMWNIGGLRAQVPVQSWTLHNFIVKILYDTHVLLMCTHTRFFVAFVSLGRQTPLLRKSCYLVHLYRYVLFVQQRWKNGFFTFFPKSRSNARFSTRLSSMKKPLLTALVECFLKENR